MDDQSPVVLSDLRHKISELVGMALEEEMDKILDFVFAEVQDRPEEGDQIQIGYQLIDVVESLVEHECDYPTAIAYLSSPVCHQRQIDCANLLLSKLEDVLQSVCHDLTSTGSETNVESGGISAV